MNAPFDHPRVLDDPETSAQEQGAFLRLVFEAPRDAVALAGRLLDLPELYQQLVLLRLAGNVAAAFEAVLAGVEFLGCLGCAHPRHVPGDCLVGVGVGPCVCGATP